MTQPTALYRHFDADGRLLYVGTTTDIGLRTSAHRQNAPWWPLVSRTTIDWMEPEVAKSAEALAIRSERPQHNDIHKPKRHRTSAGLPATRGASQTTPAEWKRLAELGLSPTEAALRAGKTPAAARKAASIYGFKFRDARSKASEATP